MTFCCRQLDQSHANTRWIVTNRDANSSLFFNFFQPKIAARSELKWRN